jgi:hypothetical protein
VRDISDHNALLINTGEPPLSNISREFRCDLYWLKNEEFTSLAMQIWEKLVSSLDPIDVLKYQVKKVQEIFQRVGIKYVW